MKYLAIVNTSSNIVENVTVDEREISDIQLPAGYIALDLATTPAVKGYIDSETGLWVEHPPTLGVGGRNMIWDGQILYQQPPEM